MSKADQIRALVMELAEPYCEAEGLELVDARLVTQGRQQILRVFIHRDRVDGKDGSDVVLRDCQGLSRLLSEALDAHEDLLPEKYHLEVGSPGLERPLVKAADYPRFAGREAKVKTFAPIDGRRNFTGVIVGEEAGEAILEVDGESVRIPLADITKAHLVHRF